MILVYECMTSPANQRYRNSYHNMCWWCSLILSLSLSFLDFPLLSFSLSLSLSCALSLSLSFSLSLPLSLLAVQNHIYFELVISRQYSQCYLFSIYFCYRKYATSDVYRCILERTMNIPICNNGTSDDLVNKRPNNYL